MSFWSEVGNFAKGAAKQVGNTLQEAVELAKEYRDEDEDFLRNKAKNGTTTQKMAAVRVLKERGCTNIDRS